MSDRIKQLEAEIQDKTNQINSIKTAPVNRIEMEEYVTKVIDSNNSHNVKQNIDNSATNWVSGTLQGSFIDFNVQNFNDKREAVETLNENVYDLLIRMGSK